MAANNEAVKSAPTSHITFLVLKTIQFICSVFVAGTWSFLFYQLMKDQREVNGSLYFFAAMAFLSIVIVAVTTAIVLFSRPQPSWGMLVVSLILTMMWIGNVVFLSQHTSGSSATPCDLVHLNGSSGIAICKLYKALLGVTIVAFVSFLAGVVLDTFRLRNTVRSESHLSDIKQKEVV